MRVEDGVGFVAGECGRAGDRVDVQYCRPYLGTYIESQVVAEQHALGAAAAMPLTVRSWACHYPSQGSCNSTCIVNPDAPSRGL